MATRSGIGYDVHRLIESRPLILGGVEIASEKGLDGHSDADVLIHAICDALLGAANLGDIGRHFPDNSEEYKDIDSKILLKKVVQLIYNEGFSIGNIDSTICLELPKLQPYIHHMKDVLSKCIGIDIHDISIKATTTERLGFVGREEGVSAYATVLIHKD